MATLYVTEPGARIEKEYRRLLVTKDDEVLLRVPLRKLTAVVLVGRVGATTPALHALLAQGVPLWLVTRAGMLIGRLLPPTAAHVSLRQAQYRRARDPHFAQDLARSIVSGKIRNQRVLVARILRRRAWPAARSVLTCLAQAQAQAQQADSMRRLLGLEGRAAKRYFAVYRRALAPKWTFRKRTRRPPRDPVNALLSLGYTFLGHALMTALEVVGLDPYLGFFHAQKYGRPALALDLVEEFRAPVVDSLVLNVLNHRILRREHFEDDGVRLTTRGLHIFLRQFSAKLDSTVKVRRLGRALSYRKLFEVQARLLARRIRGDAEGYQPFRMR